MIQMGTTLNIADNSGAKKAKCIKVLGGSKKMSAKVADKIIVSIKECLVSEKVKKGDIFRAIVVRTKSNIKRKDGVVIKFSDNAIVLLNEDDEIIGTRIFGPIPKEIKETKFQKIISLACEVT